MSLPINLTYWIVALLPIVVLMLLMVKYRWGAAKAAPIGVIIALVSGITLYKAPLHLIALESAKGIWNAIAVLTVILPAILIYEVTNEANAFEPFRKGMQKFTPNELLQILAIGWVFVSFLQGVTGFGVPVAVGAPLLVGIGVTPLWAVIISLYGQAWANTFGTLAVAWDALVLQTGITDPALIKATALWASGFNWLINIAAGIFICYFYGGSKGLKTGLPAVLIISLIHGGGQMLFSQANPTLANFVMACIALAVVFLLGKTPWYNKPYAEPDSKIMDRKNKEVKHDGKVEGEMSLHQAFIPYYALTFITLFVLLIKPIEKTLSFLKIGFSFPETVTAFGHVNKAVQLYSPITVFTHSGTFLFVAALIGYFSFKKMGVISSGGGKRIFLSTMEKVMPAAVATIGLIVMSKIMDGTGQTVVLAYGTANATQAVYPVIAPFIGVLGSFMTSSNMSSNILFGSFQDTMSSLLGLDRAAILGAQTGGGAIGSVIAPGKVLLGTTTTGILGLEGEVMGKILPPTLLITALSGVFLLVFHLILG
ncbi:MAG: L-lactate permease [Bacillota bacterium]